MNLTIMNESVSKRIENLDTSMFNHVESQTSLDDRYSLLMIQRAIRREKEYVYLEIGSHLGGTIQPHYADQACRRIYSVDKRPLSQPDERGEHYAYPDNSTQTMRDNLTHAYPDSDQQKLTTFDIDASEVDRRDIDEAPDFCFIDGEHTDKALISDFRFCQSVAGPDVVIATHDSNIVVNGIQAIKDQLDADQVPYAGFKLGGSIYAFVLGSQTNVWQQYLADILQDEAYFVRSSRFYLNRQRREANLAKWPLLKLVYRCFTLLKDNIYRLLFRGDRRS